MKLCFCFLFYVQLDFRAKFKFMGSKRPFIALLLVIIKMVQFNNKLVIKKIKLFVVKLN